MSEERIPVWRAKDEPPAHITSAEDYVTMSYVEVSAIERAVLEVLDQWVNTVLECYAEGQIPLLLSHLSAGLGDIRRPPEEAPPASEKAPDLCEAADNWHYSQLVRDSQCVVCGKVIRGGTDCRTLSNPFRARHCDCGPEQKDDPREARERARAGLRCVRGILGEVFADLEKIAEATKCE